MYDWFLSRFSHIVFFHIVWNKMLFFFLKTFRKNVLLHKATCITVRTDIYSGYKIERKKSISKFFFVKNNAPFKIESCHATTQYILRDIDLDPQWTYTSSIVFPKKKTTYLKSSVDTKIQAWKFSRFEPNFNKLSRL